jgi:cytidylate kinase
MFMAGKTTKQSTQDISGLDGGENNKPLVTISGEYGAGVYDVGSALAEKLGVGLFDYRSLDKIVTRAHSDRQLRGWMDKQSSGVQGKWMQNLLSKGGSDMSNYLPYLVKTIMAIVPNGGVIIGHGAHLILVGCRVMRLKVEAGPKVCAQRIAEKEGVTVKAAGKLSAKINKERIRLVKDIYSRFPTENTYYDLVLSSEILNVDQIARITLAAMKEAKLPLR